MDPGDAPLVAGRYRLGPLLGRGGMASVYEAEDVRLGRLVAIKFLDPSLAGHDAIRLRFEEEARSAARLNHPNVVAVFDSGEWEGRAYLVMELLSGQTLSDEIAAGPLSVRRVTSVMTDLLGALDAAHRAGILHRDVKPANLLLAPDGRIRVADFGIAKAGAEASELTATGQIIGTPGYLAPERLAGQPATHASDVWAAGVVGWEALAGRRAYKSGGSIETAMAIMSNDLPPVASIRPDVPADLATAIDVAVRRDPRTRWRSAAEMAGALRGRTVVTPVATPVATPRRDPPTQIMQAPAPSPRRWGPSVFGALATILVAAIIAVVVLLVHGANGGSSGSGSVGSQTTATTGSGSGAGAATTAPTAAPTTAAPATTQAPDTTIPDTTTPPDSTTTGFTLVLPTVPRHHH